MSDFDDVWDDDMLSLNDVNDVNDVNDMEYMDDDMSESEDLYSSWNYDADNEDNFDITS